MRADPGTPMPATLVSLGDCHGNVTCVGSGRLGRFGVHLQVYGVGNWLRCLVSRANCVQEVWWAASVIPTSFSEGKFSSQTLGSPHGADVGSSGLTVGKVWTE